jgi:hypothetical protein
MTHACSLQASSKTPLSCPYCGRSAPAPEAMDENDQENSQIFGLIFHIFLIIFVLFRKYGKRYKNGIGCHGNRSGYDWTSIPSVFVLGGKIR